MLAGVGRAEAFLGELRRGVHVARVEPVILGHRLGVEWPAAARARRLVAPGVEVGDGARAGTDHAVGDAAVPALAVDDHARRQHDAPGEAALVQRAQQARRAAVVARHVLVDVGEVDAEADLGGLVAHGVDAVEDADPRAGVADVGPAVLRRRREVGRLAVVRRRVEVVDDDDVVAGRRPARRRRANR